MPTKWKDAAYADLAEPEWLNFVAFFRGNTADDAEQKARFIAGEIRNPRLAYPKLKGRLFLVRMDRICQSLESDTGIQAQYADSPLQGIYVAALERSYNKLRLAQAAQFGDMWEFSQANAALGFTPQWDIFNSVLYRFEQKLEQADQAAYAYIIEQLPRSNQPPLEFPSAALEAVREPLLELCDRMGLPRRWRRSGDWEPEYTASQVQSAFDRRNLEGWEAEVTSDRTACSTEEDTRRIYIPSTRSMKALKARSIAAHELLHAWRYWLGEQSGLYLLYKGTANCAFVEEGIATALEQAVTGKVPHQVGSDTYLALGLAAGLGDDRPRDFRDVYEIMEAYYQLTSPKAAKSPQDRAWAQSLRVFRGTDCHTPGVYWGKDITYSVGKLAIANLLAEHPERIDYFTLGKFNPANQTEVDALVAADIIPDLS